jgi:hypothetical protein
MHGWIKHIALKVGEQREMLDENDGADKGQLRIMFSIKDYPSLHRNLSHEGRRASMLTLVWAPPARLSGVRLHELRERWQLYQKHPLASRKCLPKFPEEINMYHAVTSWIKPEAAPTQSSFAALCDFGPVDTFVSHFWGSPLNQTLESLQRHADTHEGHHRIWICSVANNQWRVAEELGDDIDTSPFRQALACDTCRCMALMLDTDGAPLKRYWCLYEIMTVMRLQKEGRNIMFDLCSPDGVINKGKMKTEASLRLGRMLADIDVEHAECWKEDDKRMISAAINLHLGGFQRMNEQIREFVVDGLRIMHGTITAEFNRTTTMLGFGNRIDSGTTDMSGAWLQDPDSPTLSCASYGREDTIAQLKAKLQERELEIEVLKKDNKRITLENTKLSQDNTKLHSDLRSAKAYAKFVGIHRKVSDINARDRAAHHNSSN